MDVSKIKAENIAELAKLFGVNFEQKDTDKLQSWIDEEYERKNSNGEINKKK